jgi:RNA polymerase sigma factor (sigma-70 family)
VTFAWDAFIDRYRPLARNVAAGIAARGADVDDLVQEALAALLAAMRKEPDRFESVEHARNYFLRTVKNLAIKDHRRRPDAGLEVEPPAPVVDADDELVAERHERVARALEELDTGERELLVRRFERRDTLAQIASDTGVPVSTLHSREKALLARLRRTLGEGGDPLQGRAGSRAAGRFARGAATPEEREEQGT